MINKQLRAQKKAALDKMNREAAEHQRKSDELKNKRLLKEKAV
ncbi:MAG: hypothetical protein QM529_00980 [Hydrotalea sp.]|nr:hypothetical protein [Hydrotalea sp.]